MLGFTTTGNRRPRAAPGASAGWLITRAGGYGRPRRSSRESWSAFDVSVTYASYPLITRTPCRSRYAR